MEQILTGNKKYDQGREKMIKKFGLKSFGEQFVKGIQSVSENYKRKPKV